MDPWLNIHAIYFWTVFISQSEHRFTQYQTYSTKSDKLNTYLANNIIYFTLLSLGITQL